MNHCGVQQNALAAVRDDMRSPFVLSSVVADRKVPVSCPKPRRLGQLSAADPIRTYRWLLGHQAGPCDSKAGAEILDIILSKGGADGGVEEQPGGGLVAASSPPFFNGSPPSRSANPLIFDASFGKEKPTPLTPLTIPTVSAKSSSPSSSSSSAAGGGGGACKGCALTKFSLKPAAVRIEGFDCLDRDNRRSHGITAVA